MSKRIIAEIVRKGGGKLLDQAIGKIARPDQKKGAGGLLSGIAGAAAVRIATRSVPGAIAVGGALLAKTLYDRRRAGAANRAQPSTVKGKDPAGT